MKFKDFPGWLKCGIVFGIIDLILIFIFGLILLQDKGFVGVILFFCSQIPAAFLIYIFGWGYLIYDRADYISYIILSILGIISWFIIGCVIGFILRKSKSEKPKNIKDKKDILLPNGIILRKIKRKK
jgi:hypothetical protein